MAADSEISLLTRGSPLPNSALKHWASQSPEVVEEEEPPRVKFMPPAGGIPSPQLRGSESDSSSVQEVTETKSSGSLSLPPGSLPGRMSLALETSLTSVQSSDSTLEFHDAPLADDLEEQRVDDEPEEDDVVVTLSATKTPAEQAGPTEKSIPATDKKQSDEEDAQRLMSEGDDKMDWPRQTQQDTEEEVLEAQLEEEDESESAGQQAGEPCLEATYAKEDSVLRPDGDQGTVEAVVCDTRAEDPVQEQPEKTFEQSEVTEHLEASEPPQESLEHTTGEG